MQQIIAMGLKRDGYELYAQLLKPQEVQDFRTYMWEIFTSYRTQIDRSKKLENLMYDDKLWQYVLRDRSRVEVNIRPEQCPAFCNHEEVWKRVLSVHKDFRLVAVGFLVSEPDPNGIGQPFHRDCPEEFLAPKTVAPHWMNLFVALENIDDTNGPPAFIPGSHRQERDMCDEKLAQHIHMSAGDGVLFAANTIHRGTANCSNQPRLLGLFVFSRLKENTPDWEQPLLLKY